MTACTYAMYAQIVLNNDVLIDPGLRMRAELAAVRHDISLIDFYASAIELQIAILDAPASDPCPACGEGGSAEWKARQARWQERHDQEVAHARASP